MKLTEFTNSTRELVRQDIFHDLHYRALETAIIALCDSLEMESRVQAQILHSMVSYNNGVWKAQLTLCNGSFEPAKAWDCIQSEFKLLDAETRNTILGKISTQFKDETNVNTEIKQLWSTVLNENNCLPLASFITVFDQEEDKTLYNKQDPAHTDYGIKYTEQAEAEAEENGHHSPTPTNYNLLLTISASLLAVGSVASLCVVALALTSVITTLAMTGIVTIAATGLISGAVAGYLFFKANTGESRELLPPAPTHS
jgi:hypothetical protein